LGTTGWENEKKELREIVESANGKIIWGGNFSLGVNLFFQILKSAARKFEKFSDDFDIFGNEIHHRKKADSPSGTARTAGEIILENFGAKKKLIFEKLNRAPNRDELHISSTRGG
jgi:4-hydroxy-tetrahydrodipicolinate reductase